MLDLVNPLEPCGGWSSAELRQNKAKASNGGPTRYLAGLHRECEFSRRRVHTELAVSFLGYKVPAQQDDFATPQKGAECKNINYDPLVMSDGIAPTDDPVLHLYRDPTKDGFRP